MAMKRKRPKRPLTPGQQYLRDARLLRTRCLREIDELRAAGRRVDVAHLSEKYERTHQCVYLWMKWHAKQKGGTA